MQGAQIEIALEGADERKNEMGAVAALRRPGLVFHPDDK